MRGECSTSGEQRKRRGMGVVGSIVIAVIDIALLRYLLIDIY
jgi:hypothetical protein